MSSNNTNSDGKNATAINSTVIISTTVNVGYWPIPVIARHGEKLKKFNGSDFKHWQQKMLFYLTTLNIAEYLCEDIQSG